MSIKILMPALSPTMTEGILQKWLVKIGDEVKSGDVLAEIETDKATMEIEAVDEGKITDILIKQGTEGVQVNSVIAILNGSSKSIDSEKDTDIQIDKSEIKNENEKIIKQNYDEKKFSSLNTKNKTNEKNLIVSPYAKKFSKDNNIDLNSIKGTGPRGRIIKRDLKDIEKQDLSFLSSTEYKEIEPSSIRKIIAERTTETMNTVPHFYLTIESEVDKLLVLRKKINDQFSNNKISINDILVKSIALSQNKNPQTNVSWFNGKIYQYSSVDVSIAVSLNEGLITPIIRKANIKGLLEISTEARNLIKKAKEGKLIPNEYIGGTITISNLGMFGISEFAAIINPPQSCILAVGSIQKKHILKNNDIKVVNIIKSTLSVDHRVLDGAMASKLLQDFNDIIENPFELWLHSEDMEII